MLREESNCGSEGICSATPLAELDYGLHSVTIQYATEKGMLSPLSEPLFVYRRPTIPLQSVVHVMTGDAPTLEWSKVQDATHYQVVVVDNTNKKTVINQIVENITSYTLPEELNPDKLYSWKVRVQNPDGFYSPIAQIVHHLPLGIPELISPDGTVDHLNPEFQWRAVQGAQKYHVVVHDLGTQEVLVDNYTKGLSYTHKVPFEFGHRYRWKVNAQDTGGQHGEYSEWSYFEFTDASPPPSVANTVTLTWAVPESRVDGSLLQPGDISQYIVEYQKEQEAIKKIYIEDVRLTELTLDNLSDGDYQFKIRVVDKMGLASDFSAGARITLPRSVKQ